MEFVQKHFALIFVFLCAGIAGGVFVVLGSGGEPAKATPPVSAVGSVSPAQFEELAESGEYQIIDIRTPEEAAEGKVIADATVIDYYQPDFRANLAKLDRDQPYLIYCRSGNRSGDTLKIMQSLGFTEVRDLNGGKVAWERSGRSLVVPENLATEPSLPDTVPTAGGTNTIPEEPTLIACPMDAMQCPDGSYVGRTGPNCEFAPCG